MFGCVLCLLALLGFSQAQFNSTRNGKFFGLGFGVGFVRFENRWCTTPEGLDGTCYTRRQCREIEGSHSGYCAAAIGRCCTIQRGCGTTSSYNNTYFVNTNFPQTFTGTGTCTFTIRKCNPDICQVRIDFISLTLAQPDADGNCIFDSLTITGGASYFTPICGENSGQHIYMGFNGENDIVITITTTAGATLARSWYLKVAQIACDCPTTAPDGCLMFYTGVTGTVNSFNYGGAANAATQPPVGSGTAGTREMANLNYGVCVKMLPGYCSIEWSTTDFLTTGAPGDLPPMACTTDYILIPNPTPNGVGTTLDRFCGELTGTATSSSKPFVLYVVTNANEVGPPTDIANRGFSLTYTQIPCNPLMIQP